MSSAATPNPVSPPSPSAPSAEAAALPSWARELIAEYESGAASQFILHGNTNDRLLLPLASGAELGSLTDFLTRVLLPRFDVVLSHDLAAGIRVEKGGEIFQQWPTLKQLGQLPKDPRGAIEALTHYLRYVVNLQRVGSAAPRPLQVGVFLRAATLLAPSMRGSYSVDLNALALNIREWASDPSLADHSIASFLICENVSDLHPVIATNPRASRIMVPLPSGEELRGVLGALAARHPVALAEFKGNLDRPADYLVGATLSAVESMLRIKQHQKTPIRQADLAELKKQLIERDANGLIEFVESDRSLADFHGQDRVREWLEQDIALWNQNDLKAMPMGYLFCGPVGTGKTFLVECLAGSAGVPVVKLKNFRDKWVGSTEGNLETIFRLLHALGRCIVFIDEADQALGRRQADTGDSGVGGRVYSMMAEEMSDTRNRGKIVWILASSRPDLIEVDLKRPGRVDVKIPLLPTQTPEDGFALLRALCKKRGLDLGKDQFEALKALIPDLLTPGAAEALAVKAYRLSRTKNLGAIESLRACLSDYQPPVRPEVIQFQIDIALNEATDIAFVPERFRKRD
jgi:ATPase family associated with various cellular activities (AAA)